MATAKVIIKGENNISSAVRGAKTDMSSFAQSMQKAGDILKKAFTITAVVAGLKKLGDACSACFSEFSQANRAYKQLSLVLKDQSSYKSVIANIDKLAKQSLSSKDQIEAMASELAALGKSSDEINRISDAAVALSNVTGKDLNSSMTTLLNTYRGTTTQLNKLGIDTSEFSRKQLESGAAVDLVISKFSKLSESMAEADTSQHLKNIRDTFGDIKQQIGGAIDFNIAPMAAKLDKMLSSSFENIKKIINYAGAVVNNFSEVWNRTLTLLGAMLQRIFGWSFISDLVTTTAHNFLTLISGVFNALEKATGGFFSWSYHHIMSDILDILAWLPDQIETMLDNIVNSVVSSPLGRLLNMKEVSFDFGSYALKDKGREHYSQALQAKGDMDFKGAVAALVGTLKQTSSNSIDMLKGQFSDLFDEYGLDIDTIVAPVLEKIEASADVTNKEVSGISDNVDDIDKGMKKGSFLDKLGDSIGTWVKEKTGATDEQGSAFGTAVITSFTSKMGEAGEVVGKLAQNMASMGPLLGAIATALEYVFEGLNEVIGGELKEQIEYGLEPLRELGRVIGELILPVMEALSPQLEKIMEFSKMFFNAIGSLLQPLFNMIAKIIAELSPVFDMLMDVFTLVAEVFQSIGVILKTVLSPVLDSITSILKGALAPVLEIISAILEILSPVLKVFAKVVVTITGTIQYVIQVLQHWVATICNWLAGLSLLGWHPFGGLRMSDPGSPGSYSSYIQSRWNEIDSAFEGASAITSSEEDTTASTSTSTSVSSAGYQGATQVTINIYQQAPVVGDGGMRAFAQMIRNEWENLSYFGITV